MRGTVRNPVMVFLLSVVTCGIYGMYWYYATGNELKEYLDDPLLNPGLDLLLCIVCFPYAIYWFYKYGKLVHQAELKANIQNASDDSTLLVVLAIFAAWVSIFIMQGKLNKIWEAV